MRSILLAIVICWASTCYAIEGSFVAEFPEDPTLAKISEKEKAKYLAALEMTRTRIEVSGDKIVVRIGEFGRSVMSYTRNGKFLLAERTTPSGGGDVRSVLRA